MVLFNELQVQTLLVAGGVNTIDLETRDFEYLDSTETYLPGSNDWAISNPLPVKIAGAAHVSLNNKVYLLGDIISDEALIIGPLISQETS